MWKAEFKKPVFLHTLNRSPFCQSRHRNFTLVDEAMLEKVSQKRTFIFQEAVFCYLYLMLTSEGTFASFPEKQCCWVFQKEKKINQREKQNPNPTSSFCKWAPGVPLAVKSYFHSSLELQNFIITAWKTLLSLSTCYFWFLTNHCNPSNFIVQIVIAVNYLRMCRNLRL